MTGEIRRMHFRDGMSLHQIAKCTGISRNTIRKWVRAPKSDNPPKYSRRTTPGKLAAHIEFLQTALKADALRHRHRGAAMIAATAATPPGMRVRTGRFERLRSRQPRHTQPVTRTLSHWLKPFEAGRYRCSAPRGLGGRILPLPCYSVSTPKPTTLRCSRLNSTPIR